MRFLLDAHISRLIAEFIQGMGHDCVHAEAISRGLLDEEIMRIANDEHRILLTSDKDFGELVFRSGIRTPGIVLLRIRTSLESDRLAILEKHWQVIEQNIQGFFVVVSNHQVRRSPLISDTP